MSTTKIILSNQEVVNVPEGADPILFRRIQEARIKLAANPKKASKKQTSRKASKKSNYAKMQSAIGRATVELIERVNRPADEPEARFVNGEVRVF